MRITGIEVLSVRLPAGQGVAAKGEFLVTPLHIFDDYERLLGEGFVGLRSGPVGAVLVRVKTDSGLDGVGSVGTGNGAAVYVLEHTLRPMLLGADPFEIERL